MNLSSHFDTGRQLAIRGICYTDKVKEPMTTDKDYKTNTEIRMQFYQNERLALANHIKDCQLRSGCTNITKLQRFIWSLNSKIENVHLSWILGFFCFMWININKNSITITNM